MNNNTNQYKSSAELKALAKERLLGKYGTAVGATVIVALIVEFVTFFSTIFINPRTLTGTVLNFIIGFVITVLSGLFTSGTTYLYLKLSCNKQVALGDVFYGFQLFPNKAVLIQLYLSIWTDLIGLLPLTILSYFVRKDPQNSILMLAFSLTAIVCGVIIVFATLIYSQAFYLLHDFPDYSVKELLSLSRKLMQGSKGRLFYMLVSFIPLMLLSMLSCGIALLWLVPYMNATQTEFFLDLMKKTEIA